MKNIIKIMVLVTGFAIFNANAGTSYIGYEAGYTELYGYGEHGSTILNNVHFGYLGEKDHKLQFGSEVIITATPTVKVTKYRAIYNQNPDYVTNKYTHYAYDAYGLAKYQVSQRWSSVIKGGIGYMNNKYTYRTKNTVLYEDYESKIYPAIGFGMRYAVNNQIDLGAQLKYRFSSHASSNNLHGTMGFSYYFKDSKNQA